MASRVVVLLIVGAIAALLWAYGLGPWEAAVRWFLGP